MKRAIALAPAAVLAASLLAACVWILPKHERNPLLETTTWSLLIMASFAGWGSAVAYVAAPGERIDLGLRVLWGAGLVCFLGGVLMVPALMGRATGLVLVEVGCGLAIAELARTHARVRSTGRLLLRFTRREPRLMAIATFIAGVIAIHYLAGIADSHTNPYDDDIAYLEFVKKLLGTGTVLEPFSFRRLSALGGQTLYVALVYLRSDAWQSNTFDRSICVLLIALLIVGFRSKGRRLPVLAAFAGLAVLLTMPFTGINTASYYSGIAFFFGLYRTLVWASERDGRDAWRNAVPLALVAAATCTLRQNYLPVPVFVFAASYGFRVWSLRTKRALFEPLWVGGLTLVALVPWLVVAYQSNRTFLYPIMAGTFNKALALNASDWSVFREVRLAIGTFLEGIPMRALLLFIVAFAFIRERDPRRPLLSFAIGVGLGFLAVVHGFTQSDPGNIGRYALGSTVAFVLAVLVVATTHVGVRGSESAARPSTPARIFRHPQIAAGIVLVAVAAQVIDTQGQLWKFYGHSMSNIETLWHRRSLDLSHPVEVGLYSRLQNSVPPGARVAVLLDEPHYLNFERNPIWNLDMPGYASLPPGIPFFQGSEKVETYFATIGVRYLAFVRPEYSRYHYRRDYWVEILVDESELWRAFAPYLIDFLDSLVAIASRHRAVFEERGLVVIDLAEGAVPR